jgi:hypothetical protein
MLRLAAVVACLAAAPAFADLSMTMEAVTAGKPHSVTMQFKGKRALITSTSSAEGAKKATMLRDAEGKRTLIIDHDAKQYSELSDASAAEMKARASQMQEQMAAKMAGLPPEQRARMEAMMGKMAQGPQAAPPGKKLTFEKKGSSRKILGKPCDEYLVKADGTPDGEVCFLSWKDAGITREAMRDQMKSILEGLPAGGSQSLDESLMSETAPGFPAWRKRPDVAGQGPSETTLVKLSTDSLPDALFEAPKGYTVRSLGAPTTPPTAPPVKPSKK